MTILVKIQIYAVTISPDESLQILLRDFEGHFDRYVQRGGSFKYAAQGGDVDIYMGVNGQEVQSRGSAFVSLDKNRPASD